MAFDARHFGALHGIAMLQSEDALNINNKYNSLFHVKIININGVIYTLSERAEADSSRT